MQGFREISKRHPGETGTRLGTNGRGSMKKGDRQTKEVALFTVSHKSTFLPQDLT